MNQLDEIQIRADKASKGPWAVDHDDYDGASVYMDDGITWGRAYVCTDMRQGEDEGEHDAEFIAAARADVPALVAALRAVEAIHTKEPGGTPTGEFADICGGCPNYWPCPTINALQEGLSA